MIDDKEGRHHKLPITKGAALGLVFAYLGAITAALVAMGYANHVATENNRKWCHVLIAIDDAYKDANVTSVPGKRIAVEFHQQRLDFEC